MRKLMLILLTVCLAIGLMVSCKQPEPEIHTVSFDLAGKGENFHIAVVNGKPEKALSEPTCDGFTFEGWYTEAEYQNSWNPAGLASVSSDMTVYAKWCYTVSFDMHDHGSAITRIVLELDANTNVAEPEAPTSDDANFIGWYTDDSFETLYDFSDVVTQSITLHAKWVIRSVSTKEELKEAFTNGGTYSLANDIVVDDYTMASGSRLNVASGISVVLDLNGHVIDAAEGARVIGVSGTLTIQDSNPTNVHEDYLASDANFPTGGVLYHGNITSPSSSGGGIATWGGTVTFEAGTIYKCVAGTYGGGISSSGVNSTLIISGGSIIDCTASTFGGGIHAYSNGALTITGGSIIGCSANDGGGLYVSANMTSCQITGLSISDCSASEHAGGLFLKSNTGIACRVSNVSISRCTAVENAGGFCLEAVSDNSVIEDLSISGCSAGFGGGVYNRSAIRAYRWTIDNCRSTSTGGGIWSNGALDLRNSTISECSSNSGGGIYSRANFTIKESTISDCTATNGGGVYQNNSGSKGYEFAYTATTIEDCTARENGGGIYVADKCSFRSSNINAAYSAIAGCSANRGAGIYGDGTSTTIKVWLKLEITECHAVEATINEAVSHAEGSAIYSSGTFDLRGCKITGNICDNSGSAVYVKTGSTISVSEQPVVYDNVSMEGETVVGSVNLMLCDGVTVSDINSYFRASGSLVPNVWISTQTVPTDLAPVTIYSGSNSSKSGFFHSDLGSDYEIVTDGSNIVIRPVVVV